MPNDLKVVQAFMKKRIEDRIAGEGKSSSTAVAKCSSFPMLKNLLVGASMVAGVAIVMQIAGMKR